MSHGGDIYRHKVKIDFSVNLNPLGTPEAVKSAVTRALERAAHYPDPWQEEVRRILADSLGILQENVIAGSGASELLLAAVRAASAKKALLFEPCFSGYGHALRAAGCETAIRLTAAENSFAVREPDLRALEKGIDLVLVCDPSSPSGAMMEEDVLRTLLEQAKKQQATVILDESFYLLADRPVRTDSTSLILEYENLIVIRSLTKVLALPGIRMGYAIGAKPQMEQLKNQLPEWNLSVAAEEGIKAGMQVITDTDFIEKSREMIQAERAYLTEALKGLGIPVFESHAPFLLCAGPEGLYEALLKKEILIRDCSSYRGLGSGFFRIGIRSHEENETLIEAIRGSMHAI